MEIDLSLNHAYTVTATDSANFTRHYAGTTAFRHRPIGLTVTPDEGGVWSAEFSPAFEDAGLTAVFATPEPTVIGVVAGGQAYRVNVRDLDAWEAIQDCFPVMEAVVSKHPPRWILCSGASLLVFGEAGRLRLLEIRDGYMDEIAVAGSHVVGRYWDAAQSSTYSLELRLSDGELLSVGPRGERLFTLSPLQHHP